MAAAEARAAWQRTANRCFVQEDAKRAPKLACCPSSSSTSKPESDIGPGDFPNEQDHPPEGFMPLNWNTSNSNLPLDTKWWLQLQPNFAYQKDFSYEELNALEAELEVLRAGEVNKAPKLGGSHPLSEEDFVHFDSNKNSGSYLDPLGQTPLTCMMHGAKSKIHQLRTVGTNKAQGPEEYKDIGEYCCGNEEFESLDPGLVLKPSKKLCSHLESPWMTSEKTEPWWRTVDKNELVSLVAEKSLELIENCDLPRPQTMHVSRGPFTCSESSDNGGIFLSSLDQKANSGLPNPSDYPQGSCTSGSVDGKQTKYCESGHSIYDSERFFSSCNGYIGTNGEPTEPCHLSKTKSDPSKAQLLEALCHSQTRARKAEKAAQQAYTENEHMIKLFFIQASHLFAYMQWFKLLQLEALCLQLKNKDQPISSLFPMVLPWMPYKGRQPMKRQLKAVEQKRGALKCDISKYAVAFAVGLGLASAGLFLGLTMGFVLPSF
ncbi:uncharacterized protein LOC122638843 isoform X2 [Telopea speciosissima]|nr:uncharacterized protein LOC122638843 isoform X2 [Telopea speciosissima]XP_043687638.1 uncharacterized protein LOC122638843 isoform X2 [Telopea speciosissima]XP_043687643.1 uncharacterized protein LOC122638843 isoform X2 [Telopea speciosissima]